MHVSKEQQTPPVAPPSPAAAPRDWPRDLTYRAWQLWVVRVVLSVSVLAAVFGVGLWYGHGRGSAADGGHGHAGAQPAGDAEQILYWTCAMHPNVKLPKPGQCPICFMDLVPVRAGEDEDPNTPRLTLSARARELAKIETAPVERRELVHTIRMVGKITADETRITHVSSYIPGRLDRLFVNYTGIMVRKGDHLAEIYSPDLLVAQREYLLALDAVERSRGGRPPGRPDEPPGDDQPATQSANALLEASRRKLELWGISKDVLDALARDRKPSDHIRIDSPLEGWVLERMGFQGMYVETGTRIVTLADLREVWVMLDAYELDLGFVRLGQHVAFETETFPGQTFTGRVTYIDPVLRPETRTVKVRVNVENPDLKLRPEMFVRARLDVRLGEAGAVVGSPLAGKYVCYMHLEIVKDQPGQCDLCGMDLVPAESLGYVNAAPVEPTALAVPQTAVLLTGTRAVVYVEKQKEDRPVYEGRVVELGPRAGDAYVVKSGLTEGERVVTRGALMIDSALQIQAKPSMMQPAATAPSDAIAAGSQPADSRPADAPPSRYVADAMYHQHVRPLIEAYLDLAGALAADDREAADTAARTLRTALKGAEPHGLTGADADTFKKYMKAVESSLPADGADLDVLRAKLPDVTAALQTYLRTFGHDRPDPIAVLFCPMAFNNKGADWLQGNVQVANPYFGKKMLRCGEVKGTLQPDGSFTK